MKKPKLKKALQYKLFEMMTGKKKSDDTAVELRLNMILDPIEVAE